MTTTLSHLGFNLQVNLHTDRNPFTSEMSKRDSTHHMFDLQDDSIPPSSKHAFFNEIFLVKIRAECRRGNIMGRLGMWRAIINKVVTSCRIWGMIRPDPLGLCQLPSWRRGP